MKAASIWANITWRDNTITIDGHEITVDIQIAESTRKANNRQMLGAYQVIVDHAAEEKVPLPENMEVIE